jgi:hypothetical protein
MSIITKKPIQGDLAELVALATKELKKQNRTIEYFHFLIPLY